MSYGKLCIGASLVLTGLLTGAADAAIMITGHTNDATLEEQEAVGDDNGVGPAIIVREGQSLRVGVTGFPGGDNNARWDQSAIFVFQLPAEPAGGVTGADFAFTVIDRTSGGSRTNQDADLYGLKFNSTGVVDPAWHYSGAYDMDPNANATAIQASILLNENDNGANSTQVGERVSTSTSGDTALAAYIQAQYDAGAVAGDYIFLRINSSFDYSATPSGVARSFTLRSAENSTTDNQPVLTIVPEPTMLGLLGVVPAMLLRRRRR